MDDLEKAQRQLEQAKARVQKLKARAKAEERKKDTRRKIILGGLVLARAKRDPDAAVKLTQQIAALPEKERTAFEGWSLENDK